MNHLEKRVAPLEALEGVRPPVLGMGQRLRTLEASVTEKSSRPAETQHCPCLASGKAPQGMAAEIEAPPQSFCSIRNDTMHYFRFS